MSNNKRPKRHRLYVVPYFLHPCIMARRHGSLLQSTPSVHSNADMLSSVACQQHIGISWGEPFCTPKTSRHSWYFNLRHFTGNISADYYIVTDNMSVKTTWTSTTLTYFIASQRETHSRPASSLLKWADLPQIGPHSWNLSWAMDIHTRQPAGQARAMVAWEKCPGLIYLFIRGSLELFREEWQAAGDAGSGVTLPWIHRAVVCRGEFTHGRHTWIPPHAFSSTAPKSNPKSQHIFIQFIQHDTWSSVYNSEQIRRPGERAMLFFKIRKFKYVTNFRGPISMIEKKDHCPSNRIQISLLVNRVPEDDSGWNGVVMRATAFKPDNASVMPV